MAFKEAPKVDAKELYYTDIHYVIQWVNDSVYGKFYGSEYSRQRTNIWEQAKRFPTLEEAEKMIKEEMLTGVTVVKVYF